MGPGLGGVREGLRGAGHHVGLLLNDHDPPLQGTRPRAGLAERNDQMVAINEGSSLTVREVRKTFVSPDNVAFLALDSISLSVEAGEFVSFLGPSGCGRPPLLRMIAGLETPSSGDLTIGSDPISGPHAERGLVFQDPNLFPWLTVRRNVQAGLVARGVLNE